jgi:hypothetical protein
MNTEAKSVQELGVWALSSLHCLLLESMLLACQSQLKCCKLTGFHKLPAILGHLPQLVHLELHKGSYAQLPPSMAGLSCLFSLYIINHDALEELPESLGCLDKLRRLHIETCPNLRKLPSSMTSLTCLKLSQCPALVAVPEGLALESLCIEGCPGLGDLNPEIEEDEESEEEH